MSSRARVLVLAGAVVVLAASMSEAQVTVVHVFRGPDGPHPASAATQSVDVHGSVSPKFLVGLTNGGFSVLRKRDGKEAQPHATLFQFWESAFEKSGTPMPGRPYDPRVIFDPTSSRWFAIADSWMEPPDSESPDRSGPSPYMLIAVSADDDPTHPWKAAAFRAPGSVDNIKLSVDKYGLYSTAFWGRPRLTVAAVAVPKADLLWRGGGKPSLEHINLLPIDGLERLSDNKLRGIEGMFPALDLDYQKEPGDPTIYVNRYRTEVGGETLLQLRKLTWTSPTTATLSEPTTVPLGARYPVQPTTRGVQPTLGEGLFSPGLAAGEGRVVNAVVRDHSLWTIAATQVGERIGAFWAQVDLRQMKLVQHGTLGDPEADIHFPSLSVDARGNLGIAMTRTAATRAASTYVTGRQEADPPNTLRPLVEAVAGRYVYFTDRTDLTKAGQGVPTSDYSTTVVDPSDPTLFWSFQFAATNDSMPKERNAGKYGTNWVAFRVQGSAGGKGR